MDEKVILRIRAAFAEIRAKLEDQDKEIKKLRQATDGHKTLLIDLRGESAYELHTSFGGDPEEVKKIKL